MIEGTNPFSPLDFSSNPVLLPAEGPIIPFDLTRVFVGTEPTLF